MAINKSAASKKKYLRITFSNGSCYDIPVCELYRYYAKTVIKQISELQIEEAIKRAEEHFDENPDNLIEFASNGLTWLDVCLDIITIEKRFGVDRDKEWPSAKKELIEK